MGLGGEVLLDSKKARGHLANSSISQGSTHWRGKRLPNWPQIWNEPLPGICRSSNLPTARSGRLESCKKMVADDDIVPMILPSARPRPKETTVLAHPALQRRSVLRDRRPHAVRRHTGRVGIRFVVLVTGDLIAIFMARAVALWLATETLNGTLAYSATPLVGGGTRFIFLGLLTIAAVFATGGHSRHRALNQPIRLFVAVAGAVLITWAGGIARGFLPELILPMVATAGTVWLSLLLVRQVSEWFLRHVWPAQRGAASAILIGDPPLGGRFEHAVAAPGGDYRVAGYVSTRPETTAVEVLGTIDDLPSIIEALDAEAVVVCADLPADRINDLIEQCLHAGCQVLFPARAVRVYGLRPILVWHHDQPFFEIGSPVLRARALISKRIVDVVVSAVLLVLLSPLLIAIAIAVRLDSRGPFFFFQERAGLGGRRFRMIKFRTMRDGADVEKQDLAHLNQSGDTRLFKIKDDPRYASRIHAPPLESRRAAAAVQRADRRDVTRRPAALLRGRLQRVRGSPFQAARREARDHRPVAGERSQRGPGFRGRDIPRSPVHRAVVILARRPAYPTRRICTKFTISG